MLTRITERIATQPAGYDLIQTVVGAKVVRQHLHMQINRYLDETLVAPYVLDLGGGTGLAHELFPSTCNYICVDMDEQKLARFRFKNPQVPALLADITGCPIKSQSIDMVLCSAVSHHLSDALLVLMISESIRVLKASGTFLFLDAIRAPKRLSTKILWWLDRGAYPRSAEALQTSLSTYGQVAYWETFAVLHRYVLCILKPQP